MPPGKARDERRRKRRRRARRPQRRSEASVTACAASSPARKPAEVRRTARLAPCRIGRCLPSIARRIGLAPTAPLDRVYCRSARFRRACGYEYAGVLASKRVSGPLSAGDTAGQDAGQHLYSVNLQVAQADNNLMVKWDRDAAPIQAALHGVLTVMKAATAKK